MGEDSETVAWDSDLSRPETRREGLREWFLVKGNRLVVCAVLLAGVFLVLAIASVLRPFEVLDLLTETRAAQTLFNTLLSGTILLVSIVVSINSIALSQEVSTIGTHRERVEEAVGFREAVEDLSDIDSAPAAPTEFLTTLITVLVDLSERLEDVVSTRESDEARDRIAEFARVARDNTRLVQHRLESGDESPVDILSAGLEYNYSDELRTGRQLTSLYGGTLDDEEREALEEYVDALKQFAIAHEYYKSLFFMREFAKLSKTLLYVALPVIVFNSYILLALSAEQFVEFDVGGISGLLLSMMAAYAVSLAPYVVLTTFVLRSATVAARSMAAGTFVMDQH